jgi:hypothetical protein
MQRAAPVTKIATERQLSKGGRVSEMTPEERERMNVLCSRIAEEKDPILFNELVRQLSELLEKKHRRIDPEHTSKPN